jgi:phage major head subunit gpT-like protein
MELITSRACLGYFKQALAAAMPPDWVSLVANMFTSDQASETYPWLDATPALREWVGGRNAKGFKENSITVINKDFEATIEVLVKDLRRDKFGMIRARIDELVRRAMAHPAKLITDLIIAGEDHTCYDGEYFFDTDHAESGSSQSNDLAIDISNLPAAVHGSSYLIPSVAEIQGCIAQAIAAIVSFLDSAGEPMNESAMQFLVMTPVVFYPQVMQAVATPAQIAETQTALTAFKGKFNIKVEANPRLTWTSKFAVFNTDGAIKPVIFQRETNYNIGAKAEGSEYEFDNKRHQYGIDYSGNVAYGLWQKACLVTMS